jgi:hypothetical protein
MNNRPVGGCSSEMSSHTIDINMNTKLNYLLGIYFVQLASTSVQWRDFVNIGISISFQNEIKLMISRENICSWLRGRQYTTANYLLVSYRLRVYLCTRSVNIKWHIDVGSGHIDLESFSRYKQFLIPPARN